MVEALAHDPIQDPVQDPIQDSLQDAAHPPAHRVAGAKPGFDLAAALVRCPAGTVLLRVSGESMRGAGIEHGDLLVVDCRLPPQPGHVVVARIDGAFTLKRLACRQGQLQLEAAHPDYPPLPLLPQGDHQLVGVALHVIRRF